jgi:hypothetical protein
MQTLTTTPGTPGGHYPDAWGPAPEPAPLWWDDASYIRYQSADPYAQYEGWDDEDWDAFNAAAEHEATRPNDESDWAAHRSFLNAQDEDRERLEAELDAPPCEHGLAAWLCAGPGHYPMDM